MAAMLQNDPVTEITSADATSTALILREHAAHDIPAHYAGLD